MMEKMNQRNIFGSIMLYSVKIYFLCVKPVTSRDTPGLKRTRIFELKSQQQI